MNPEVAALMALLKSGDSSYDLLVMRLNSDTEIEGCLNDQDQDGNTLLHHLVQNRAINCLRYIFSKTGIDIYKTNNSQKTAVETIPEKATQVQREEIINLFHQYEVRQLWAKIEKSQKEAYAVKDEFKKFTEEYDGYYKEITNLYDNLNDEKKALEKQIEALQQKSKVQDVGELDSYEEQLKATQYLLNRKNVEEEQAESFEISTNLALQEEDKSLVAQKMKILCQIGCVHGGSKFKQSVWIGAINNNDNELLTYLCVYSTLTNSEVKELSRYIASNKNRYRAAQETVNAYISTISNSRLIRVINNDPVVILIIQYTYNRSRNSIASDFLDDDEMIKRNIITAIRSYFGRMSGSYDVSNVKTTDLFELLDVVPLTVKIDFIGSLLSKDEIRPEDFYQILETLFSALLERTNLIHLKQGTLRSRIQELRTVLIDKFADLITINDQVAFKNIPQSEFTSSKKGENLLAWISYFNELTLVVVSQIAGSKSIDKSTLFMEFYIHLAAKLRDKHNYQSMMAIIVALDYTSVFRLKAVNAGISDKAKTLFSQMKKLVDKSLNSKNMREMIAVLNNNNVMLVPSIGTYCSDLTFANDAERSDKVCEIAEHLAKMQERLSVISKSKSVNALRFTEYVKKLYKNIHGMAFSDKDDYCYQQSLKLEPLKSQLAPSVLLISSQLGNIFDPMVIDGEGMASILVNKFRRFSTNQSLADQSSQPQKMRRYHTGVGN